MTFRAGYIPQRCNGATVPSSMRLDTRQRCWQKFVWHRRREREKGRKEGRRGEEHVLCIIHAGAFHVYFRV